MPGPCAGYTFVFAAQVTCHRLRAYCSNIFARASKASATERTHAPLRSLTLVWRTRAPGHGCGVRRPLLVAAGPSCMVGRTVTEVRAMSRGKKYQVAGRATGSATGRPMIGRWLAAAT